MIGVGHLTRDFFFKLIQSLVIIKINMHANICLINWYEKEKEKERKRKLTCESSNNELITMAKLHVHKVHNSVLQRA